MVLRVQGMVGFQELFATQEFQKAERRHWYPGSWGLFALRRKCQNAGRQYWRPGVERSLHQRRMVAGVSGNVDTVVWQGGRPKVRFGNENLGRFVRISDV